jgi:hypothetical protein
MGHYISIAMTFQASFIFKTDTTENKRAVIVGVSMRIIALPDPHHDSKPII